MALGEFGLIERYFRAPAEAGRRVRGDVPLGIGDDAAVLAPAPGSQLVAAIDTLVESRHFPAGSPPASIGHRALAVNLSDLAAMGAEPAWFLLALTLPRADEAFLAQFAQGMLALAAQHRIALVGGDTTSGPLTVSVQVLGQLPAGAALTRAGGAAGDLLFVSGTPGDAAAGLALLQRPQARSGADAAQRADLVRRFEYPEPRVALGMALRGLATACIDVSDGLAGDAGKLAAASGCAAVIDADLLPLSSVLLAHAGPASAGELALTGGDDYELCFTAPAARRAHIERLATNVKCAITCIGRLEPGSGVRVVSRGKSLDLPLGGFDHFGASGATE